MRERDGAQTAIFAGGCFWGIEEAMRRAKGVVSTEAGYIGGTMENPTYKDVKTGTTGHAEAVRVVFDPTQTSYEELARRFFEIHDPTQVDRQGPDIGPQYRSEIFYLADEQRQTAEKLISRLRKRGFRPATRLTDATTPSPATTFHRAEEYHQRWVEKSGRTPCSHFTKRF
jgi:peptide methionine sulfoxide reductase msrA/msrB